MADTTRRSPHFTLWQRNIKNVKNKVSEEAGHRARRRKAKRKKEEAEGGLGDRLSVSEELVIDAEVRSRDIVGVDED